MAALATPGTLAMCVFALCALSPECKRRQLLSTSWSRKTHWQHTVARTGEHVEIAARSISVDAIYRRAATGS